MKKIIILLNILLFKAIAGNAQVGINTSTPNTNAVLELNSQQSSGTYGGFIPPRITSAQRDAIAITSADDGLMAYVHFPDGKRCLQIYNGVNSVWESINCIEPITAWSETLGNPGSSIDVTSYTGYDNNGINTYTSGSTTVPQVKVVAPLSNLVGGSGFGYLFFTQSSDREFTIGNINVSAYTSPLTLKLLIFKEATPSVVAAQAANGSELVIDYYNSATSSWTVVTVTDLPTGSGTENIWYARTLSATVPNTITKIRFTRTTASGGPVYRIDDIKLIKP
ncbi:hypothetical protein [Flavobacterium capsici]|uniref:MAM domain-containing protein n=1 Tax=Flavobacterium capsici TaxID=3075618 RepID=A0AA96F2D7_9FLAO|nr:MULTISPECIES: hypothetical protein [unclassified Flavobacterium]WNM20338.1 hypothetical protein RN608_06570 [Flavobacterium sp. PMR2A8]WNM21728.1 hypothetical protein RN605_13740 [Flavobacterium sp. PMTSA4]